MKVRRVVKQPTDYGKWIKKRLIDKNMTVAQLADIIGVSQSMISKIIYGDTPGNQQKDAINKVLSTDIDKVS
ncbi:hypothetical protein CMETHOX_21700 [Lacrimispora indolis]|nr:hypothetical protein CMETHOX_21700 [[Clostridium] methoxybenzovorans]